MVNTGNQIYNSSEALCDVYLALYVHVCMYVCMHSMVNEDGVDTAYIQIRHGAHPQRFTPPTVLGLNVLTG